MTSLRILVVDDDPDTRRLATLKLTLEGHRVVEAENGALAVRRCTEEPGRFDLIVMDLLMPVMSGVEAIAELKAHHETRDIPIIILSVAEPDDGLAAGAEYYVAKPYRGAELLEAIAAAGAKK